MNFQVTYRRNPATGNDERYFRLKESFRDAAGMVRNRTVLTVGFEMNDIPMNDVRVIGKVLTSLREFRGNRATLFGDITAGCTPEVRAYIDKFWQQIVDKGSLDLIDAARRKEAHNAKRLINVDTMKHTDVREAGAEWICLQAIRELEIDKFLKAKEWSKAQIDTALAHLITRTVYSPSELGSLSIMAANSAACELVSGNPGWRPGFHSVYKVAPALHELKEELENHLCRKTDDLFNLANRIVLFDLTNFYFEGRKSGSEKAKFGRSKEKRSDCKLIVLALCVNPQGFIRYSSVLAGNAADPDSLPDMVDTLKTKMRAGGNGEEPTLVCLDAGIATESNLLKIKEKGYDYLCVSRRRLTDYELAGDAKSVTVYDTKRQPITLAQVRHEEGGDYFLQVHSEGKELKETSMNRNFKQRFEEALGRVKVSLTKKGGTKSYEKVIERVGRIIQRYPSIAKYYVIEYKRDDKNQKNMADIEWRIAVPENVDKNSGIYFLRTNRPEMGEKQTWDYYNLIREIECTNRQLKLDLCLRPIYHKKDGNSDAHIFLGLLAYWIVNTIRHKLKQQGECCYWTEIVRRMSTQKIVTTEATNAAGEMVRVRLCSEPTKEAKEIYEKLRYEDKPFRKAKNL